MDASNSSGNTTPYEPTADERAWMKRQHRMGWHARGGWCRIFPGERGRTYFGKIEPGEAVRAMHAAEVRRQQLGAAEVRLTNLSVKEAVNLYLNHLDRELKAGRIGDVQRASYGDELARFAAVVGKSRTLSDVTRMAAPEAIFAPLRTTAVARGLFAAEKHVTQVRTFLGWCSRIRRFIPAPNYGDSFDAPTEKEKRANRKTKRKVKGSAYWTPGEVRELVNAVRGDVHRYAQVLLMLNGGMGSTDLSNLEDADVDWTRRCIHTDRSKTLVPRVVPLWGNTLEAMKVSRTARAKPADLKWADRFFLTDRGRPLVTDELVREGKRKGRKTSRRDSLKNWFQRLVKPDGPLPHLKRHGAGAYTLRAVFATLARGHDGDPNLDAIVMGQKLSRGVLDTYLRGDMLDKLRVVTNHVHAQVFTSA